MTCEEKKKIEADLSVIQIQELPNKDFITVKIMLKEIKEEANIMDIKMKGMNRILGSIKNNQMDVLELKNI